ncbi:MAG: hypothetical protein BMS9Abin32_447 [Gammaproteobacteria bacterium]|nr:MAG: hypothetical protein BMS9Abin32_447 [Gammaproteobacteria bacterium]
MNDLLSEKEQVEALRGWWQENGSYVIGGIVLGVALLVGWNQWQGSIRDAELSASATFETLMNGAGDGDVAAAEAAARDLEENYATTVYATQAQLVLARLYMDKGRDQDAADALRALLDSAASKEIRLIARLRLARVLLYEDKAQEVVALLQGQTDSAFAARFSEVLGDAYAALEQYDQAADAYAVAITDDPAAQTVDRVLVQMKINDLPEAGKMAAIDESLQQETAPTDSAGTDAAPAVDEGER